MHAGDVVRVDFAIPVGSEPGFERPAIVVTADLVLTRQPRTIHVVPVTSNVARDMVTEVRLPDDLLDRPSAAQCHLCSLVSVERIAGGYGRNTGPVVLAQVRAVLGDLLDIP